MTILPTYSITPPKNEFKAIRDVALEIRQIQQQTEYIKSENKLPPVTPDFYKQLNSF